jgi:uncharacterized protein YndB with AHSA1/START domain
MPLLAAQRDNDVAFSFRIRADCSRVFYAISIPEYIEAWFRLPVEEGLRFVFNPIAEQAFRIDLYRAEASLGGIYSQCDIMKANQIRYTWKTRSSIDVTNTVIEMKLLPVSRGCTLNLRHSGFRNAAENAWHTKLWELSLESLCRLMEK